MWAPDAAAEAQLAAIFKATLLSAAAERAAANDALAAARAQPDFLRYLCHLLVADSDVPPEVRAAAGVSLKNAVLKPLAAAARPDPAALMPGLASHHAMVRNITGNVITALFAAAPWPEALPQLLDAASQPPPTCAAAVAALAKICEDLGARLDPLLVNALAQRLFELAAPDSASGASGAAAASVLAEALQCLTHLVAHHPHLAAPYLQVLFGAGGDARAAVRKNVCAGLAAVRAALPAALAPHMAGVVRFCVHQMHDDDEDVAIEACEFLLALAEHPEPAQRALFAPTLPDVLPALLQKMVYADEHIFLMLLADSKEDTPDSDRNVRPSAARARETHSASNRADLDLDLDLDSDLDAELDLWNLRRCAAATLDALSLEYPAEVIAACIPLLQDKLVLPEWPVREAAILAFGAVSKSCIDHARDKLPTLVPFLVDRMNDAETRVRLIACWTLLRYARWVCAEALDGGAYASYFPPTFEAIVRLALDPKKIVQEAACSALAAFVEDADVALLDRYVGPLLDHFANCFAQYQRRNLLTLYDCVTTFVEKIGPAVFGRQPEYAQTLLPPLFANWESLQDDDTDLWPLLECMSVVAAAMEDAFAPYAVPVYERAVKILANALRLNLETNTDPAIEAPEKDFIVTSLDLIDGLVQGFKDHAVDLLLHHGDSLMPLVLACLEDADDDVRQLAYALLGDLAIFACRAMVQPAVDDIVVCIGNEINNRSYASFPVTNNAIWAFGEIAIKATPESIAPYAPNILTLLIPLLNLADTHQTLLENAAICIGRLGVPAASLVSTRLPELVYSWCSQMMYVLENEEKESAFLGFLHSLQLNPDHGLGGLANQQGRKNLAVLVSCIGNYFEPSDELKELFYQVLAGYRDLLADSWETEVLGLVDSDTRGFLQTTYGV